MALILDKLKFGEFNDVKENDDSHTGDRRLTSPLTALRFAAEKAFSKDTLLGISEFLGVIVGRRRINFATYDYPGPMIESSLLRDWARGWLLDEPPEQEVRDRGTEHWLYRVYIPELEPLPAPKSYCDPVLVGYKEMPADIGAELMEGYIVRVRYGDANNLSEPKIIKLVSEKTEWDMAPNNNTSQNLLRSHSRSATTVVASPSSPTTPVTESSTGTPSPPPVTSLTARYIGTKRESLPNGSPQNDPPTDRPYIFPIKGMTRWKGNRMHLYNIKHPTKGEIRNHLALDHGASEGTDILAIAEGVVEFTKELSESAGNYIIIKHADTINDDFMYARYLHMQQPTHLSPGDVVRQGEPIGKVGTTGESTNAHLHFDIYKTSHWGNVSDVVNAIGYYPTGDVVAAGGNKSGKTYVFEDMIADLEAGSP